VKTEKRKSKTGQAAIEPRTSSRPGKILRQFSHGDGYPTVARRLPVGCEQPHPTRYTITDHIYKIFHNISLHCDTFTRPYIWPNWNANAKSGRAGEVKKEKEKEKGQVKLSKVK
jgi:hypothetical protein